MQTIELNQEIKYQFLNDIIKIYEYYSDPLCKTHENAENVGCNSKYIVRMIESNFNNSFCHWNFVERNVNPQIEKDDNKAIICFSGGKDSMNIALKLKEKYDLTLLFVNGINKSYPNEIEYAKKCADYLKLPLIVIDVKLHGNTIFMENPVKNLVIYGIALNYGLPKGIIRYYFGNAENETIKDSNFDRDFSDSKEMFKAFTQWVSNEIGTTIINETLIEDGLDSIIEIGKHGTLHDKTQSCLLPYRFQKSVHNNNEKKYNIKLPLTLCGSCWKCCVQYIIWADRNYIEYNKDFYIHCLDFLKSKSLEERKVKAKTYKEAYLLFMRESDYEISHLKKEIDYDSESENRKL